MIRTALASDAAALWAVRRAAIQAISTQYYTEAQRSAWRDERTVASYMQPIREKIVRVAELQGVVVGYAQLDPHLCEVQALYVDPQHGGNGIGTALLQDLESRALSLGIVELQLESSLNAVGFYAKAGYRPCDPSFTESHLPPVSDRVAMVRGLAAPQVDRR